MAHEPGGQPGRQRAGFELARVVAADATMGLPETRCIIDHAAMPAQAAVSDAELVAQLSCIHTPEFRAAAEAFRSAPASNGRPAPVRG
ncbi:MAG TPA: hypothetical protein VGP05_12355 [Pseudonocardia sp.]|nr:hypothetical protein [Pseudonocardia sp.]